jgi:hypothetical protein
LVGSSLDRVLFSSHIKYAESQQIGSVAARALETYEILLK